MTDGVRASSSAAYRRKGYRIDGTGVIAYIADTYGVHPEYLWEEYPTLCVVRHTVGRRWFALIGVLDRARIGAPGGGAVAFLNVKNEPHIIEGLLDQPGFVPAYHMNKKTMGNCRAQWHGAR